jgi:uncharacterized protein DUF6932
MSGMPIPDLDERGFLPVGLFPCTWDEVKERFGQFTTSDRRTRLAASLRTYIQEVRSTGVNAWLIIDGSFVTGKPEPSDIDLVLVLGAGHDLAARLGPSEYNVISRRRVRKRHKFDILVAREKSKELDEYVAFFQQVRGAPEVHKGLLRLDP